MDGAHYVQEDDEWPLCDDPPDEFPQREVEATADDLQGIICAFTDRRPASPEGGTAK